MIILEYIHITIWKGRNIYLSLYKNYFGIYSPFRTYRKQQKNKLVNLSICFILFHFLLRFIHTYRREILWTISYNIYLQHGQFFRKRFILTNKYSILPKETFHNKFMKWSLGIKQSGFGQIEFVFILFV